MTYTLSTTWLAGIVDDALDCTPVQVKASGCLSLLHVERHVFRRAHYFKILKSIVGSDSVAVMDNLVFRQQPTNHLFHYQTMLKDVSVAVCVGMLRIRHKNVTVTTKGSAPGPSTVQRTAPRRVSTLSRTVWLSSLLRQPFTNLVCVATPSARVCDKHGRHAIRTGASIGGTGTGTKTSRVRYARTVLLKRLLAVFTCASDTLAGHRAVLSLGDNAGAVVSSARLSCALILPCIWGKGAVWPSHSTLR